MSNPIIDRQREYLANLENPDGMPPIQTLEGGEGSGAPSAADSQSVQGHEPPAPPAPGAAPTTQPAVPPVAGTADETLKQANADLARQVEEYKTLYNRQLGMVAPLQRKLAEQERLTLDLQRRLEEATQNPTGAPPSQTTSANPPAQAGADDPALKEFNELYGDMTPGVKALIRQEMGSLTQQVKPAIELSEQNARTQLLNKHLAPLYALYPNAGAIIQSPQFQAWVGQQPSYSHQAIIDKLMTPENYPVDQIISIYDEYSRVITPPQQPPPQAPPAGPSPGEMAVDIRRVPTSSTPGGTSLPQPLTRERLNQLNRALTVDRELYTDAQITAFKAELSAGEAASNAAGYGLAPRLDTLTR